MAYSVGKLASFSSNPSPHHIRAIDRVLHYVACTRELHLDWWPNVLDLEPTGYTNADYAGDSSDRKSIGAYFYTVGDATFSWSSKKQSTVATSTTEAEYIALYMASQQAAWIYQFSLGARGGVPGWYTANTLQGHGQSTHHIPTWALEVHS